MEIAIVHIAQESNETDSVWHTILEKAVQKDRIAQGEIYKRYHGKWLGVCFRYFRNRDDALEALNHAFLKIFNKLDTYKPSQSFGAWGYRIVQNTAIDYARKSINKSDYAVIEEVDNHVSVDPKALDNLENRDLVQLIHRLPRATKIVFNLYAFEGYKHREIAKKLSISEGTSKWHLNSARSMLKKLLKETAHGE